jgi:two-component system, response regulator, stage 0 sporulation protein F
MEKLTLLYVDDEPINLMLLVAMFRKKYNVLTGRSGFEGLGLLEKHDDIKVVISDMRMPGMNGLEFIEKAKATYPNIIFFILTGYEITIEIENSLKIGLIDRYFQKPFQMSEIDSAINAMLNSQVI